MNLSELIQRAVDIASRQQDTAVTRYALEAAAEPLLPIVFRQVGVELARTANTRTLLRRTKTLNFVGGVVTLTSDVLTDYVCEGHLADPTDRTKRYSLAPWNSFITDELDPRLGHFAVEGEATMRVVEPNTTYDPTTGPTVTLELTTPCAPVVPATAATAVAATDEVVMRLVGALAAALSPR